MTPSYNVTIRFDEALTLAWRAYHLTHPQESLSGTMKALLREFLRTQETVETCSNASPRITFGSGQVIP